MTYEYIYVYIFFISCKLSRLMLISIKTIIIIIINSWNSSLVATLSMRMNQSENCHRLTALNKQGIKQNNAQLMN